MRKILIIEDDYIWQSMIEMMLSSYPQFEVIGCADSVEKALQLIESKKPDIIISDLLLGQDNALFAMENTFHNFPTLFISALEDENLFNLAMAYPISTFLVKPFHSFSLISSVFNLAKHCTQLSEESKFLSFRGLKSGMVNVKFANIIKIEVEGNYSICFTSDGKKYARKVSLNTVLKSLDERFLRISKSTVVNFNYITKIDFFDRIAHLESESYYVGRSYMKKLRNLYNGN